MSGRRRTSNIGRNTRSAKRMCLRRDKELAEKREARLSQNREKYRVQRARESPAQINLWENKINSAMNYDSKIPYQDDPIVSIGTMTVVCEHCSALKFMACAAYKEK
ncbi:hypothetical protein EVAR_32212_1 [Eumeta japonica]|uniref:Uncharacterized protein n=1 Tax=Eumeta variegata TaxID=151549 RepID=A0A4C1VWL5_EUMVA|nr:hypothetical protein EVAR_32212_1 [Eumeta japonica]